MGGDGNKDNSGRRDHGGYRQQSTKHGSRRNGGGGVKCNGNGKGNGDSNKRMPTVVH